MISSGLNPQTLPETRSSRCNHPTPNLSPFLEGAKRAQFIMGRKRRKNRRGRSNWGSNNTSINNSLSNTLDRDDDFPMRGVEHNTSRASPNQHRWRRDHDDTDNKTNIRNFRGGKPPKNRNPFGALLNNPFRMLNLDGRAYQDDQGSISQQQRRNRNRNRARNQQGQNNQDPYRRNGQMRSNTQNRRRRDQDLPSAPSTTNQAASNNQVPHSSSTPSPSPFSRSASPARLTRSCTECSAVRRANIKLRDWCASALACAFEVLDGWSDEVDVSRGSGDEMDWQPEPVVRVLILTTPAPAPALSGTQPPSTTTTTTATTTGIGTANGTGTRWGQQGHQPDGNGSTGNSPWCASATQGSAAGAGFPGGAPGGSCMDETKQSSRGLKPETLCPAFSTIGMNNSAWVNSRSEAGVLTPGNASVFGQGGVGQGQMDVLGSRVHDAFGLHSERMLSPPNTPLCPMIS